MELSEWFRGFENGIARLTEEQRETFFAECGKNCVDCGTLQIYRKLYEDSDGDLDEFFAKAGELPGVKSEIIEKGFAWHLYFMECTCLLHHKGYVLTPLLCECSRQSILHVLHSLWHDKTFNATICESVLCGSKHCKMRISVLHNG